MVLLIGNQRIIVELHVNYNTPNGGVKVEIYL
jgi:hypothetical protein